MNGFLHVIDKHAMHGDLRHGDQNAQNSRDEIGLNVHRFASLICLNAQNSRYRVDLNAQGSCDEIDLNAQNSRR